MRTRRFARAAVRAIGALAALASLLMAGLGTWPKSP
jgi:hypothetical protein